MSVCKYGADKKGASQSQKRKNIHNKESFPNDIPFIKQ